MLTTFQYIQHINNHYRYLISPFFYRNLEPQFLSEDTLISLWYIKHSCILTNYRPRVTSTCCDVLAFRLFLACLRLIWMFTLMKSKLHARGHTPITRGTTLMRARLQNGECCAAVGEKNCGKSLHWFIVHYFPLKFLLPFKWYANKPVWLYQYKSKNFWKVN